MQFVPLLAQVEDQWVASFTEGGGVPYSAYARFHQVMAEQCAQTNDAAMVKQIIPLVPGLADLLTAGIRVADIGCGQGHGNTAWVIGGPVRSWSRTRGNPSAAPSWLHPLRPGAIARNESVPGARTVEPGQVARFLVVLAGNGRAPGPRTEGFGVVWEGVWASSTLVVLRYDVAP